MYVFRFYYHGMFKELCKTEVSSMELVSVLFKIVWNLLFLGSVWT